MFTDDQISRFWSNVNVGKSDECWNWKIATDCDGYGKLKVSGKVYRSNRVAYSAFYGDINPEDHILHSCDNRKCCNPAHLRKGTHSENMRDMSIRGRKPYIRKRLSRNAAENIRNEFQRGASKHSIARDYMISTKTVRSILNREIWK